ncbi:MAG: dihydrolipoamide acetyltransferase family protein [Desulfuromusa sp.]|nr:dihydrolipoamide acetyltransferase family protein [Desulfuromusa sp.]
MADFIMPSLGADMTAGILVAWRVEEGDQVENGDVIAEVETEKGLFEVEVFSAGMVEKLLVQPSSEKVPVGTILATIGGGTAVTTARIIEPGERLKVSPAARKFAAEKNIDLRQIKGTGPQGSICLVDVEVAGGETSKERAVPAIAAAKKPTDFKAGMRQAIAAAMSLSNREIPHYYLATDIDMSRALNWLVEQNRERPIKQRLLPVVLSLKAVARALEKVPELNATWVDGQLQLKKEVHIGVAIALRGGGLITPALHNVDQLSLDQLMTALSDLIIRTRTGKLRGSEMTDAGITVTSLGDLGVQTVYGVIYPPQVALVGLGRISECPWAENGLLGVRQVLTATLAADHRASDGHLGGQFLDALNKLLQEPEVL